MIIRDYSLYFVLSGEYARGRGIFEIARQAVVGGVDMLQMREKYGSRDELMYIGRRLSRMCADNGVIFIVNDDPYLAKDVGADGVHLGQADIRTCPLDRARAVLGGQAVIGVSTHSPEQFGKANESDADYIAYGPVFETGTKDYFIGTKDIPEIMGIAAKPVFFIGGINLNNVDSVLDKGGRNIAVIRAIARAENIITETVRLKDALSVPRGNGICVSG